MTQVISKNALLDWLGKLAEDHTLVAPTMEGELVLFKEISNTEDMVLDPVNTVLSPKEWFFPRTEILFTVERKDGKSELVPADAGQKVVIFGLHPCDAKSIALMDKPFLADPLDGLYKQHRDRTTLVGLACSEACPECFCISMGSAPNDASNVDVLLTTIADGYAVEAVTEKGEAILASASVQESDVSLPSPPSVPGLPTDGLVEKVQGVFDDPYWGRVADRCLHCNVCAYVCPACYCFDIRDYTDKGNIERIRTWESCQSPGFTKIAGGHDPRTSKGARLRQRWYHKFYYFPHQFGEIACVGCGRCVRSCPVNIDIREIIRDVQSLEASSDK